jgi:aryl-alcohol dehydrogenase-like predicted oxidoreductase
MKTRNLGPFPVSAIGLGCMSLSHAYGSPPPEHQGTELLLRALDLGYTHLDTAALYGLGHNETLLGKSVMHRRGEFTLASKCGMRVEDGKREISSHPEKIRLTCEDSLRRLGTEVIDLYYLHRWDKVTPIEEAVGALGELVREGKIRSIGLSEVSAATLRKAHATHPVAAIQSEYSPWTRNPEIAVLDACEELGVTFVAFSPVARGFLTDRPLSAAELEPRDIRRNMPRFQDGAWQANLQLRGRFVDLAREAGCATAQLSLAWVLAQRPFITPIPGTTRLDHLEENAGAAEVNVADELLARVDALINRTTVQGPRYAPAVQLEIDTEEFAEAA